MGQSEDLLLVSDDDWVIIDGMLQHRGSITNFGNSVSGPSVVVGRATPNQFPCIFREAFLEEVSCQVCGQKDKTASVYACGLHGKCTVGSHGVTHDGTNATARVKVCISCDDRNEVG